MTSHKVNKVSEKKRRLAAWVCGTLIMPFVAFPMIKDATPDIDFDGQTLMILVLFWAMCSLALGVFLKKNM